MTPTGQTGFKAEIDGKKIPRPDFEEVGDFLSYTLHPEKDLSLIKFKPNKNLRSNYPCLSRRSDFEELEYVGFGSTFDVSLENSQPLNIFEQLMIGNVQIKNHNSKLSKNFVSKFRPYGCRTSHVSQFGCQTLAVIWSVVNLDQFLILISC